MSDLKILEKIKKALDNDPRNGEIYQDYLSWCINNEDHEENKVLRKRVAKELTRPTEELFEVWRHSLLWDATVEFDAYCMYIELNRENKFYMPRRKQLLPIVKELQRLEDDELDLLCVSCPPGIGKTALAVFYETWVAGRHPDKAILTGSHNASFLKGLYGETLRILDKNGEYLWKDVFPYFTVARANADLMQIDLKKPKKFSTFQYASAGSGMAGKVRAQQLLYCDDLIPGIEEALSMDRLDKKWEVYTTDYKQRKQGKCKELMIATRWSVADPIGRLEEMYGKDPRAKFITMPAVDEKELVEIPDRQGGTRMVPKSNFDYGGDIGFSSEFYADMHDTMDEISWRALYMNEPIEREGLLYIADELNRYYELPEGQPDAVLGVCDTAEGGGDDTVMPIFAVYGNNHYLIDCVCSDGLPEVTDILCADCLVRNNVKACQFESNSAGGRTADKIEELVKQKCSESGKRATHITKKRTLANKLTKIVVNSSWVKENCYFLDDSKITVGTPYFYFMKKMCSFSPMGKNKHDDVPDALAQYALFTENMGGAKATLMQRMF